MAKYTEVLKKYSYPLCLGGLFLIAFFLRAYRLGEIPDVLHVDEAGLGYNAWSLANYGVDRYLNEWPIYPQNYSDGQSPLATYCIVLLLKLFPANGLTLRLLRIPALLFSMLAVVCTPIMLKMAFGSKKTAAAGMAFITFCPYFIMAGRYALDCNLMFSTGMLAITLLIRYLQKPSWPALLWCGGGFALVLYSYALSYMILPIFLITISLYMLYKKKIGMSRLLVLAGEIILLGLPIILFVICMIFKLPGFRFLGIHITPTAASRLSEFARVDFWTNFVKGLKVTLINDVRMMDTVDKYYTMYVISVPFIIIGFIWSAADFIKSFIHKYFTVSSVFILYFLAIIITIGFAEDGLAHAYRVNAIFVCYIYFWVAGIRAMLLFLRRYRRAAGITVCMSYAVWTAAFLRYYFLAYSVAASYPYPNSFYFIPEQPALTCVMEAQDAENIYVDSFFTEFFYFFYPCSPYGRAEGNPFGDARKVYATVNDNTPIEAGSVYMVRKGNGDFLRKLQESGVPYETEEFTWYYVFMIP